MRFRLLPTDDKFFPLFDQAAANAAECARRLRDVIADSSEGGHERINECEHHGDEITRTILQRLNSTFVTPFDREDIYALASALDDIVDFIEEVADFLGLYRIEAPMEQAQAQARILHTAARAIAAGIPRLRSYGDMHHCTVEVNRLENEGDRVIREALASLFERGIDPMMVIRWKDIFERLEDAIDATEKTANILEGIVIKNR